MKIRHAPFLLRQLEEKVVRICKTKKILLEFSIKGALHTYAKLKLLDIFMYSLNSQGFETLQVYNLINFYRVKISVKYSDEHLIQKHCARVLYYLLELITIMYQ